MTKVEVVKCENVAGSNAKGKYDFNTCDLIVTKENGDRVVGQWMMPKGAKVLRPGLYSAVFDLFSYSGQIKAGIADLVPLKPS